MRQMREDSESSECWSRGYHLSKSWSYPWINSFSWSTSMSWSWGEFWWRIRWNECEKLLRQCLVVLCLGLGFCLGLCLSLILCLGLGLSMILGLGHRLILDLDLGHRLGLGLGVWSGSWIDDWSRSRSMWTRPQSWSKQWSKCKNML